eukprot:g42821.t1
MKFNPDKCEVMHFGGSSTGGNYTVNGRTLRNIDMQKDLDVQVLRSLKVATQVDKKDVDTLERVRKRFTRMLSGMGDFSYEEKLNVLCLFSLENRRLSGDLIKVYKIVNGIGRVESMRFIPQDGVETRLLGDTGLKWAVVEGDIIATFKKHLDEDMTRKGMGDTDP